MVPHVAARKTNQRFLKFSFFTPKRLQQQYLPKAVLLADSIADRQHDQIGTISGRSFDRLVGAGEQRTPALAAARESIFVSWVRKRRPSARTTIPPAKSPGASR
jgi:hypothetical protein